MAKYLGHDVNPEIKFLQKSLGVTWNATGFCLAVLTNVPANSMITVSEFKHDLFFAAITGTRYIPNPEASSDYFITPLPVEVYLWERMRQLERSKISSRVCLRSVC